MSHITTKSANLSLVWQVTLATLLAAVVIMAPDLATASDTPIGGIFCIAAGWMIGNTGKGIATIAVTIIGIGALLGKVSWGMALIVGLGIALVFGASAVINAFGITGVPSDCSTTGNWGGR